MNQFTILQEIYKDRKKFSKEVFEVASSDLVNMGITVVSYTLKDIRDEEVSFFYICIKANYWSEKHTNVICKNVKTPETFHLEE